MLPHRSAAVLLAFTLCAAAQTTAPPPPHVVHDANFDAERKQADALYTSQRILDALPLYEDLCRQDNTIAVFAERHGSGLLMKAATLSEPKEAEATRQRGFAELRRAHELGDNSQLVQNLLDIAAKKNPLGAVISGIPLTVGYTYAGTPAAQATVQQAEAEFAHGHLDQALELYKTAAQQDPKLYNAPLFAGDMYFREGNYADAGTWFAKAIAIDPNRDTAYRYWGDALMKAGSRPAAKQQYEQAVVAEPYNKPGWSTLRQWAQVTGTPFQIPIIQRPQYKTDHGVLVPDPALAASTTDGRAAWLVYERVRVQHGGLTPSQFIVGGATMADGTFKTTGYRHSLGEEVDALTQTADEVRARLKAGSTTPATLDSSLQTLLKLQDAHMLAPWVLLNGYDQGIMKDLMDYRAAHRDLLIQYIDTVVVPSPIL